MPTRMFSFSGSGKSAVCCRFPRMIGSCFSFSPEIIELCFRGNWHFTFTRNVVFPLLRAPPIVIVLFCRCLKVTEMPGADSFYLWSKDRIHVFGPQSHPPSPTHLYGIARKTYAMLMKGAIFSFGII